LRSEDLEDLHSSQNIMWTIKSRRTSWAGHVARTDKGGAYGMVAWGKMPLGRPSRRWEDNIKTHLLRKRIEWLEVD
jgi:hypothetical protein